MACTLVGRFEAPALTGHLAAEVTTSDLREWLAGFTGPDAARDLVDAVFGSRPSFFVDQQR